MIINKKKIKVKIVIIKKNNKFLKLILMPMEKINNKINKIMNMILQFLKLMDSIKNTNKCNNHRFKAMKKIIDNKCKLMKILSIVYTNIIRK